MEVQSIIPKIEVNNNSVVVITLLGRKSFPLEYLKRAISLSLTSNFGEQILTVRFPTFCNVFTSAFVCTSVNAKVEECPHESAECIKKTRPIVYAHPYYLRLLPDRQFVLYGNKNEFYRGYSIEDVPAWVLDVAYNEPATFEIWRVGQKLIGGVDVKYAVATLYTKWGKIIQLPFRNRNYADNEIEELLSHLIEDLKEVYRDKVYDVAKFLIL